MNALQARMFIEQILAQPSVRAAAQVIQADVQALDTVFFVTLQQMILEESRAELGNRRNTSSPHQRLRALQMLKAYAWQLTHHMTENILLQREQIVPPSRHGRRP